MVCGVAPQQQGARGRALPPRVPAAEVLLPQPRRSRGPWKDLFCLRARSGSGEFQPGLGWVVLAQIFCSLTPELEHKRASGKVPGAACPDGSPGVLQSWASPGLSVTAAAAKAAPGLRRGGAASDTKPPSGAGAALPDYRNPLSGWGCLCLLILAAGQPPPRRG